MRADAQRTVGARPHDEPSYTNRLEGANVSDIRVTVECRQRTVRVVSPESTVHYCSPACARRAAKQRRHRRKNAQWLAVLGDPHTVATMHLTTSHCPWTGKVPYPSEQHAWLHIAQVFPEVLTMNAYPCDKCGSWHVGNSKSAKKRHRLRMAEIRAAKRMLCG